MSRPAWMTPIQYNDGRFGEPEPGEPPAGYDPLHAQTADDAFGVDDDDDASEAAFESTDTEPLDYANGPHDDELGVDDDGRFESNDREPLDYASGPHDDEFGLDDDDEND